MKNNKNYKNLGKNLIPDFFGLTKKILFLSALTIFISCSHEKGDKLYVNVNSIKLLDKPFGIKKMVLEMNDTLTFISEMNDNWIKVSLKKDTFFIKDDPYKDLVFNPTLQETPFTKWKALKGQKVEFNHPDGYYEVGSTMMKNGDIIKVRGYSKDTKEIEFRPEGGLERKIPVEWAKIDWKKILKKYPKLKEK